MKVRPWALFIVCLLLIAASAETQRPAARRRRIAAPTPMPVLHKIIQVTLSPSYSCQTPAQFATGYNDTALFLSSYSKQQNSPELLFNGFCGGYDYFEGATAGEYLDVIADYGDVAIDGLTAQQIMNIPRVVGQDAKFSEDATVVLNHTYGVLINKDETRGFFFFRVIAYVPNQSVTLEYVVEDYQITQVVSQSPGFDWSAPSFR